MRTLTKIWVYFEGISLFDLYIIPLMKFYPINKNYCCFKQKPILPSLQKRNSVLIMTTSTLIANTPDWVVNSKFKIVFISGGRAYIEEKEFRYSGDLKINYNILFLKLGGYMDLFYC